MQLFLALLDQGGGTRLVSSGTDTVSIQELWTAAIDKIGPAIDKVGSAIVAWDALLFAGLPGAPGPIPMVMVITLIFWFGLLAVTAGRHFCLYGWRHYERAARPQKLRQDGTSGKPQKGARHNTWITRHARRLWTWLLYTCHILYVGMILVIAAVHVIRETPCFGDGSSASCAQDVTIDWSLLAVIGLAVALYMIYGLRHLNFLKVAGEAANLPRLDDPAPLPFQRNAVLEILDVVDEYAKGKVFENRVLSISGGWGTGKSTIVNILRQEGWHRGVPIVMFNAWRYQSRSDLEVALFDRICAQLFATLRTGWWLRPSLVAFLSRGLKGLRFGAGNGTQARVDLATRSPSAHLYPYLIRLANFAARRDTPIVVIVDEIDRCDPLIVQAMLSLTQRLLTVENMIVLIPYVEDQIRFKAFHPAVVHLPELRSSAFAVLRQIAKDRLDVPTYDKLNLDDAKAWIPLPDNTVILNNADVGPEHDISEVDPLYRAMMLELFRTSDRFEIDEYFEQLERRFVRGYRIKIGSLQLEDMQEILRWRRFERGFQAIINSYIDDDCPRELRHMAQNRFLDLIDEASKSFWSTLKIQLGAEIGLRAVVGRLSEAIALMVRHGQTYTIDPDLFADTAEAREAADRFVDQLVIEIFASLFYVIGGTVESGFLSDTEDQ